MERENQKVYALHTGDELQWGRYSCQYNLWNSKSKKWEPYIKKEWSTYSSSIVQWNEKTKTWEKFDDENKAKELHKEAKNWFSTNIFDRKQLK